MRHADSAFGMGCFHFGVVGGDDPLTFSGREYAERLAASLNSLANVRDLELQIPTDLADATFSSTLPLPNVGDEVGFFPHASDLQLSFKITIPSRIQRQLVTWRSDVATFTEDFEVSVRYSYFAPVAFVKTLSPSQANSPTDGLIVVREFLKQHFSESGFFRFESLGPTPFHADCFVDVMESYGEESPTFVCNRAPAIGYDEIIFSYNPLGTLSAAEQAIFDVLENELDFFYYMQGVQSEEMTRWMSFSNQLGHLNALETQTGLKGYAGRLWFSGRDRNGAFIALTEFESLRVIRGAELARSYRDVYPGGGHDCLRPYVDRALKERGDYPTEQSARLLSLFESRRASSMSNIVAVTAGLVGVAIGALLTALLT